MRIESNLLVTICVILLAIFLAACSNTDADTRTGAAGRGSAESPEFPSGLDRIARNGDGAAGYVTLASAYIRKARETGDFPLNRQASEAIDKALAIAPDDVNARKLKASLHLTFHEFAEGLTLGEKLSAEMPSDSFVLGVLTDAHTQLGNYQKAVELAQKMVDARPNSQSYARAAYLRWLHGDIDGSAKLYKLAAKVTDPADHEGKSWCLTQLGDIYWRDGKYGRAVKVYDEALSLTPNYPLAMFGKGRTLASQRDFHAALHLMSGAIERSPHTGQMIAFGDVLGQVGRPAEAEMIYSLADNPDILGDTHDAHRFALFMADNDRDLDKALAIAEADYAGIKDVYAADILAWCLYKKGRLVEAQERSREALRIGTPDAVLYYHAGMIEYGMGNRREARQFLRRALDLNPGFDLRQAETAQTTLSGL